jgi:aspartate kinase
LHDKPVKEFDYYYDQVVCVGELLSTCIVSAYLDERGVTNEWLDVRDILRTDDNFRDANVDYTVTHQNLLKTPIATTPGIYVTQGFIGATDENESTTLGREGSDYTAAIFANLLNAESLTIWKDVAGVMSADPKEFPEASFLPHLSFNEVIEMAFYGAQVIHPKTIKPLHNKQIPLHVRSFLHPDDAGTVVNGKAVKDLPPVVIVKKKQVVVDLRSQDFSFVGEQPMSLLYRIFGEVKVRPNLIQTGAISVQLCLDDHEEKINHLAAAASECFDVQVEKGLSLLTVRHYNDGLVSSMLANSDVVLTQKTKETVQVVFR